jgi:hypothetical protein
MDLASLRPGEVWRSTVHQAIAESEHFAVLLSPFSVKSTIVLEEISIARQVGKPIIPLLLQECDLPAGLGELQWIDFRLKFDRACSTLRRSLDRATDPADKAILTPQRRPVSWFGFTPVMHLPCPLGMRISAGFAVIGLCLKLLIAIAGWMSSPHTAGDLLSLRIWLLVLAFFGAFQFVMGYRVCIRHHTFVEILSVYVIALVNTVFGAMWIKGSISHAFVSSWIIPMAFDALLILSILPRSVRRWMIAYPTSFFTI